MSEEIDMPEQDETHHSRVNLGPAVPIFRVEDLSSGWAFTCNGEAIPWRDGNGIMWIPQPDGSWRKAEKE